MKQETILRAYDKDNDRMVYSTDEDAVFIHHQGKWEVHYREENKVEIDAPVLVVIRNPQVEILKYNTWMKLFVATT